MTSTDSIAHLVPNPHDLAPELLRELVAIGPRGIEEMIAYVGDPKVDDDVVLEAAAVILGTARVTAAIPALLRRMAWCEADELDLAYPSVLRALWRMRGPELVEPLLAATFDEDRDAEATLLLAASGVRDARIRARITDLLRHDPELGADAVLEYGDASLVSELQAAFDGLLAPERLEYDAEQHARAILVAMRKLGVVDEARTVAFTARFRTAG